MAPVDNKLGKITFVRGYTKQLGECHACKPDVTPNYGEREIHPLQIDFESNVLVLCAFHEGMLLEHLLTNYVKRVRRGSKVGFVEPIQKELECQS